MFLKMLKSKIHRATVTEADLDYIGSITIDQDLLDVSGMLPGQCVLVADLTNGTRHETYAVAGPRGSGTICINGAAAHLVHVGDQVIIMAFAYVDAAEAAVLAPRIILVDERNRMVRSLSQ